MTQINWQYQVNNRAGGYIVTNTDWNDVAGDLRALIDQTTSSTTDNTPLPIGIDLANDRVYISDPDSTTPEDGNHADTTLSVVGTTTLAGDVTISGADLTVGGGDLSIGTTAAGETLNIAGVTTASGAGSNLVVKAGDATGTNQAGAYLALKPGLGTGNVGSGDILLQTGPAGASGATLGTATTVLTCTSAGSVVVANDLSIGTTTFTDPATTGPVTLTVLGGVGQIVSVAATPCDFLQRNSGSDTTWLQSHRASGGSNALQWWYHNGTSYVGPQLGITTAGAVHVAGALSKGSGSFDIPHPTRGGDWRLRHSFIEGPQADLIYRGTVTLSGGTAAIDLDTASHMTDGTWEALCRDPWAMVASSGNAVEWSLSGKTLTITSDTAAAVCSWMVIAERQDDHMKSPEGSLADDDGYLIVEYEREASPPPAPPEEAEEAA